MDDSFSGGTPVLMPEPAATAQSFSSFRQRINSDQNASNKHSSRPASNLAGSQVEIIFVLFCVSSC